MKTCLQKLEIQVSKIFTQVALKLMRKEILSTGSLNETKRNEYNWRVSFMLDKFCCRRRQHPVVYDTAESKFVLGLYVV